MQCDHLGTNEVRFVGLSGSFDFGRLLASALSEQDMAAPQIPGPLYQSPFSRHKTRVVSVGGVPVGGDHPIVVQSMTTPDTSEVEKVLAEIHRLEEAGCELVRVTVPKPDDAAV